MAKNIFKVKLYLLAKDPEEATRLMQKNNVLNDTEFDYEPMWDGKQWVIWFRADLTKYKRI